MPFFLLLVRDPPRPGKPAAEHGFFLSAGLRIRLFLVRSVIGNGRIQNRVSKSIFIIVKYQCLTFIVHSPESKCRRVLRMEY